MCLFYSVREGEGEGDTRGRKISPPTNPTDTQRVWIFDAPHRPDVAGTRRARSMRHNVRSMPANAYASAATETCRVTRCFEFRAATVAECCAPNQYRCR